MNASLSFSRLSRAWITGVIVVLGASVPSRAAAQSAPAPAAQPPSVEAMLMRLGWLLLSFAWFLLIGVWSSMPAGDSGLWTLFAEARFSGVSTGAPVLASNSTVPPLRVFAQDFSGNRTTRDLRVVVVP